MVSREEETTGRPRRAWTRPGVDWAPGDDDGILPLDDLHLHRYCAVYPFLPDDDVQIADGATGSGDPGQTVRFVDGLPRRLLRHTPMVVLSMTVLLFVGAEVWPDVGGITTFLPSLSPVLGGVVGGGVILGALGAMLLVSVGIVDYRELYAVTVVYGLLTFLTLGTAASVLLVVSDPAAAVEPNVLFTSGYLLTVFLCGLLAYDLVLRSEHMLETLGETHVVSAPDRFRLEVRKLQTRLTHTLFAFEPPLAGRIEVRTAYVAPLFAVVPGLFVWVVTRGPQGLAYPLTLPVNFLFDYLLGVLAFQFLILVHWLYGLVNDDVGESASPTSSERDAPGRILTYVVYHPDGHGGYRDLGKFATRVNVVLIVAGMYVVYRLFVQGLRVPPNELAPGVSLDPALQSLLWLANFAGPVVIYPILAGAWLYYSFWQIHLRMIRERERLYARKSDDFRDDGAWHIRTEGPSWPVSNGQLFNILLGSLTPVVTSAIPVLVQQTF